MVKAKKFLFIAVLGFGLLVGTSFVATSANAAPVCDPDIWTDC
jgi:hypothetical protein